MSNAIIISKQSIRELENVSREMVDSRIAAYTEAGIQIHWQSIEDECGDVDSIIVIPADSRETAYRTIQATLVDNEIVVLFEKDPETRIFEIWYTVAANDRMMEKLQQRGNYKQPCEEKGEPEEYQLFRKIGHSLGEPVYGAGMFVVTYGRQWW